MATDFENGFHSEENSATIRIVNFLKEFSTQVTQISNTKSSKARSDLCAKLNVFMERELTQGLFAPEIVETSSVKQKFSEMRQNRINKQ